MASLGERLWHYQRAVQQPEAVVTTIERIGIELLGQAPTRLREDFAGTAAIAEAWVRLSEDHRALAVEHDQATAAWAARRIDADLGERAIDCPVVVADVMDLVGPRVDAVAALNFSIGEWHDRPSLVRYLKHARRCLDRRGVVIVDLFGGRGAWHAPRRQRRRIVPSDGEPFDYVWEQRAVDPVRSRVTCTMHFDREDGRWIDDAFAYDWRLWGVRELTDAMADAGLEAGVWAAGGKGRGMQPVDRLPGEDDWVAWVVGVKGP
ncbi:MAG: class I SAM-dependent methyltransferase [Planctomycetota bacterium]